MGFPLSLRIDRRFGNEDETDFPTLTDITGHSNLEDLLEGGATVSARLINNLEYYWFEKGLRPCDTVMRYRGSQRSPLWRLHPTGVLRPCTEHKLQREQSTRGLKTEKISISAAEFWTLASTLCSYIQPPGIRLNRSMELVPADSEDAADLIDLLYEAASESANRELAKLIDRFIRLFFCKGHKFGKAEQALVAIQMMVLCFSDLEVGLFDNVEFGRFWLFASLTDSTRLTKQYKKWTTNREHTLFEFIGDTPNVPEEVDVIFQKRLDDYFLRDSLFHFVGTNGLDDKVFEATAKWLQYFIPSRSLPCPDDDAVAEEYVKYTNFLTTRGHIGTHATEEEVKEWTTGAHGAEVEDFLSSVLAATIARKAERYPDGAAAKVLQGTSGPAIALGTTSNYTHSRAKGGHYGTNAEVVLPFLEMSIEEAFPFVMETEDGLQFICDDHGIPLCPLELGGAAVWQVAYADSNEYEEDSKLLQKPSSKSKKSDRLGLDSRYGNCLYLYSTWATRDWRESVVRLQDEFGYDLLKTEAEVRDLIKRHGLTLPKERTVPVLEPGGKTRWVSAAEAALLYYQYPLAEDLRTLYTEIDGARVGLTGDAPLFRFEQSFADHTLDKILQNSAEGISPAAVFNVKRQIEDSGGDEIELRVAVTCLVARAVASNHKIHPLAALASLTPRGCKDFHVRLASSIKTDPVFTHSNIVYDGVTSYTDLDRQILAEPSLRWQILVVTTTDMVKATDTFLHGPLRKNLLSVLKHLGFD